MAVRNLDAIKRHGTMIAEQRMNEKQMREDNFWKRVNIIKACHEDAVDLVETVDALYENGLGYKFEEWIKQQNVNYTSWNKKISVCCLSNDCVVYLLQHCSCIEQSNIERKFCLDVAKKARFLYKLYPQAFGRNFEARNRYLKAINERIKKYSSSKEFHT